MASLQNVVAATFSARIGLYRDGSLLAVAQASAHYDQSASACAQASTHYAPLQDAEEQGAELSFPDAPAPFGAAAQRGLGDAPAPFGAAAQRGFGVSQAALDQFSEGFQAAPGCEEPEEATSPQAVRHSKIKRRRSPRPAPEVGRGPGGLVVADLCRMSIMGASVAHGRPEI